MSEIEHKWKKVINKVGNSTTRILREIFREAYLVNRILRLRSGQVSRRTGKLRVQNLKQQNRRGIFWLLCRRLLRLWFHRQKDQRFCVCCCGVSGRTTSLCACARLLPCILRMNSLYWRIFYCGSSVHALPCGGLLFDYRGRYGLYGQREDGRAGW